MAEHPPPAIEKLADNGWLGTLQISRTSTGWYVAKRVKVRKRWRTTWSVNTATLDDALSQALTESES